MHLIQKKIFFQLTFNCDFLTNFVNLWKFKERLQVVRLKVHTEIHTLAGCVSFSSVSDTLSWLKAKFTDPEESGDAGFSAEFWLESEDCLFRVRSLIRS